MKAPGLKKNTQKNTFCPGLTCRMKNLRSRSLWPLLLHKPLWCPNKCIQDLKAMDINTKKFCLWLICAIIKKTIIWACGQSSRSVWPHSYMHTSSCPNTYTYKALDKIVSTDKWHFETLYFLTLILHYHYISLFFF